MGMVERGSPSVQKSGSHTIGRLIFCTFRTFLLKSLIRILSRRLEATLS